MNWAFLKDVARLMYDLLRETIRIGRSATPPRTIGPGAEMVKCPRCYTYVTIVSALSARIGGNSLHFCSKECLEAYRRDYQDIDAAALKDGPPKQ